MKNLELEQMGVREMDAWEVKEVDGGCISWSEVLAWIVYCLSADYCNWSFVNVGGGCFEDVAGSYLGG